MRRSLSAGPGRSEKQTTNWMISFNCWEKKYLGSVNGGEHAEMAGIIRYESSQWENE